MLSMHGGCVLTGLVLGALLNSLAGQVALCDPPEPNAAEAQSISAPTCDAEDVGVTSFGPLPVAEKAAEHDLDYRTHFERRMRISKQAVYRAEFRKS